MVVLIDEYDKPILDALGKNHENANRQKLRDFYSPLKACDEHLRFVLLTGITKVSHVNIFSGLNQLKDASLSDKYSSICGITEKEMLANFEPEIKRLSELYSLSFEAISERLKRNYDGYHFSRFGEGIYNPFCLLCAFDDMNFGSYWMASGTPTMLVKRLESDVTVANRLMQDGREVNEMFFADYDPNSSDIAPLLYQSGYLTIVGYDLSSGIYRLGFPNKEVTEGLMTCLLPKYLASGRKSSEKANDTSGVAIESIRQALMEGNAQKVVSIVSSCISGIPTIMKESCENYYESLVHVVFRVTGFEVVGQAQSSAGRADIVLQVPDCVWIFELKMDGGAMDVDKICDSALRQIDDKGYSNPYLALGKKIRKVALVFSSKKKGVVGWKEQIIRH